MKIDSIKIKLLMAEQELKQSELAEKVGMSRQNLSTILTRGTCSTVNAGRIAKALGVDVREIVKED